MLTSYRQQSNKSGVHQSLPSNVHHGGPNVIAIHLIDAISVWTTAMDQWTNRHRLPWSDAARLA